jgi:GNAT superfamily N-acetyltransferase
LEILVRAPADCSKDELSSLESLIRKGGEVTALGLRERIANARLLACATVNGNVVAVAALKKPNPSYQKAVFEKACSTENPIDWPAELGWIFVEPGYRQQGIATRLVTQLLADWGSVGVFATTREKNDPVLPLLGAFSFESNGEPYSSSEGDYNCVLHLKRR